MSAYISDTTIMAALEALETSRERLTEARMVEGRDTTTCNLIDNRIASITAAIEELTAGLAGEK